MAHTCRHPDRNEYLNLLFIVQLWLEFVRIFTGRGFVQCQTVVEKFGNQILLLQVGATVAGVSFLGFRLFAVLRVQRGQVEPEQNQPVQLYPMKSYREETREKERGTF